MERENVPRPSSPMARSMARSGRPIDSVSARMAIRVSGASNADCQTSRRWVLAVCRCSLREARVDLGVAAFGDRIGEFVERVEAREDRGEGRAAGRRRADGLRNLVVHGREFFEAATRGFFVEQQRELAARRREALIGAPVGVEQSAGRFAEHLVETHRALQRGDVGDEAARQARALHALEHQLLAGRREVADLEAGVHDRDEQRTRDEREAQQHQSAQRFWSRPTHLGFGSPIYQGSRCRRFSHSSEVRTMVSMSSSLGCHLSSWRTRVALGDQRRRITGAARFFAHVELEAGDLFDAGEDFAHAVAVAVADVGVPASFRRHAGSRAH